MASRSPSSSPTRPSVSGSSPVVQASFSTGCMTKNVRNSASPISTMLGGVPCVASALRSSDSTMTMRVKAVTITSRLGASDSTVTSAVICTSRPVAPACAGGAQVDVQRLRVRERRQQQAAGDGATQRDRHHGRRLSRVEPADHDVLRAAGQQQHAPLVALDQMQAAARIERQHVLHREQAAAGRAARHAAEPRHAAGEPDQRQHREQCGDGGEDRGGSDDHGAAFCRAGMRRSAGRRGARRQGARQRLHRTGQCDQPRTDAAAFVRRQVERLGAQQTDLAGRARRDRSRGRLRPGRGRRRSSSSGPRPARVPRAIAIASVRYGDIAGMPIKAQRGLPKPFIARD